MKKRLLLILSFIFILFPLKINADMIPISVNSYSNEVAVGSTVTYVITGVAYDYGNGSNLGGKFIYDSNYLEYLNIDCAIPGNIEGEVITPDIKIIKNSSGELSYKVENSLNLEGVYEILISFKVKAVPNEGYLKVNFYPETKDVLYGAEYVAIGAKVLGNQTTEDQNEFYYPEDEEETVEDDTVVDEEDNENEENEVVKKDNECKDLKERNKVLLISMIISLIVNVLVIICLIVQIRKCKLKNSIKN